MANSKTVIWFNHHFYSTFLSREYSPPGIGIHYSPFLLTKWIYFKLWLFCVVQNDVWNTYESFPSSNFTEIIERHIKRIHSYLPKKMRNYGSSRTEKFEEFLEDKKQIESNLWRKPECLNQHRRNWLKRCKLFSPTEPWGDSQYREWGAGHGANIG